MLDASTLHDALRSEGLVPPEEDVHLLACSNRWHGALNRIDAELFGDDDPSELREKIEELEDEAQDLERKLSLSESDADSKGDTIDELESQASLHAHKVDDFERRIAELTGERDRALAHAIELEAALAAKGTP